MLLSIKRVEGPWFTVGFLNVDGTFCCYTLEDKVRPPGQKVAKQTAIPYGRYRVELTYSPKFNQIVPQLMNVPDFTGVRIHWGNFLDDTDGCPLVGDQLDYSDPVKGPTIKVGTTHTAYDRLVPLILAAHSRGEEVWCEIVKANPQESSSVHTP